MRISIVFVCLSGIIFLSILSCGLSPENETPAPSDVRQTNSSALPAGGENNLYQALSLTEENASSKTGVLSLENGGNSLVTRLWLFRQAKRTIDIQYFSFARNLTGLIACDYVVQAADRGVKVRLLIDEAAGKMNQREIKILDLHDNIEVRIYNAGLKLGRADKKLKYMTKNRNRMMRRMHNKTVNIDGVAAILGGRNISDEYFDFDHSYNFRDRDVLLLGKAAKDVTRSFEDFWNDKLTVTCEELVGKTKKEFSVPALFEKLHTFAADTTYFSQRMREKVDSFPGEFRKLHQKKEFMWLDHVHFVSDKPGKNDDREERKGGISTDTMLYLIRHARKSIDIHTPYFITNEEGRQLLKETVARGVRVRVLTNSLASIDNPSAFSAYQNDRKKNLETGIELYEFRPDPEVRFKIMMPEVQDDLHYDPTLGFHSKSMIVDGGVAVIGSYNFDPRSANLNTECVAVMRSEKIADVLFKYMDEEYLPQNSWRISEDFNPDSKASVKKKVKVVTGKAIPKELL
jgi:cardiolipin synthase C